MVRFWAQEADCAMESSIPDLGPHLPIDCCVSSGLRLRPSELRTPVLSCRAPTTYHRPVLGAGSLPWWNWRCVGTRLWGAEQEVGRQDLSHSSEALGEATNVPDKRTNPWNKGPEVGAGLAHSRTAQSPAVAGGEGTEDEDTGQEGG